VKKYIFAILYIALICACTQHQLNRDQNKSISDFVDLPHDLGNIHDSVFNHLDHWLEDAEIIGISEGEHGMNEALSFRNSYIKFMVRTSRIQVLAFESGLIESRLVDDYINGKELNIDTVLVHGFSYTFGQFEQNKELLKWLRKTNASREINKRVHFYGFDMSGSAPNPFMDNPSYALKECLEYLKKVDAQFYIKIIAEATFYFPYLNNPESSNSDELSLKNLQVKQREKLHHLIDNLKDTIKKNKKSYIEKYGLNNYEWALVSLVCFKQNLAFLEDCLSATYDQSSREKYMLDNLKWIMKKEGNKKTLLFAHLSHLAKDISRLDEQGNETIPRRMFGELIAKEFKNQYKVIGNFFNYLDYYDSIDSVNVNSFSNKLHQRYKSANFCIKANSSDSFFLKRQMFGIPFKGNLWMTPSKGVDVIFYTEKQHFYYKE
jgi:erythromycin esterase-like protein